MRMLGKRNQYLFDYKIGLNEDGKIQALTTEMYADGGWSLNDMFSGSMLAPIFGQGCYKIPTARTMLNKVRLDTPTPTAVRAPGMTNGHAMIESIMQHCTMAQALKKIGIKDLAKIMTLAPIFSSQNYFR